MDSGFNQPSKEAEEQWELSKLLSRYNSINRLPQNQSTSINMKNLIKKYRDKKLRKSIIYRLLNSYNYKCNINIEHEAEYILNYIKSGTKRDI